jgi:hypothetical protein
MQLLAPTFQWKVLKQPNKRGSYLFLETLGGSYLFLEILGGLYGSIEERMTCLKACAMASSRPML